MDLQSEQKVVLRLRAYNRAGLGPWSDEIKLQAGPEEDRELKEIGGVPQAWSRLDFTDLPDDEPNGIKMDKVCAHVTCACACACATLAHLVCMIYLLQLK